METTFVMLLLLCLTKSRHNKDDTRGKDSQHLNTTLFMIRYISKRGGIVQMVIIPANGACAHYVMVSNFNGSHFGLPPSEIHRMTGLQPQIV